MTRREFLKHLFGPILIFERRLRFGCPTAIDAFRSFGEHLSKFELSWKNPIGRLGHVSGGLFGMVWISGVLLYFITGAVDARRDAGEYFLFVANYGGEYVWESADPFVFWIAHLYPILFFGSSALLLIFVIAVIVERFKSWQKFP